jgi:hypothetical protein
VKRKTTIDVIANPAGVTLAPAVTVQVSNLHYCDGDRFLGLCPPRDEVNAGFFTAEFTLSEEIVLGMTFPFQPISVFFSVNLDNPVFTDCRNHLVPLDLRFPFPLYFSMVSL